MSIELQSYGALGFKGCRRVWFLGFGGSSGDGERGCRAFGL